MNPVASPVQEFLGKFRKGDRDAAFFGLLELDRRFLPELMSLFPSERDAQVRAFLVEILWQHRQASIIPFLEDALQDPAPEVWKEALNGLVTLASPAVLGVLRRAKSRRSDSNEFLRWVDEAIDQVDAVLSQV
ncbi:MAG: HEAT repeat domain-containing protein [Verrucomicrobiota bacterium]